jgi:pilus assembly protein CpaC
MAIPPELEPSVESVSPAGAFLSTSSGILQGDSYSIRVHTHQRIPLVRDVERVAIGSPEILDVTTLSSRELLALGRKPGQTSIMVWYTDGEIEQFDVAVSADIALLERTLTAIHPSIRVEKAPDRDALVLTGRVPKAIYSRRAEEVVNSWVSARPSESSLLVGAAASMVEDAQSSSVAEIDDGGRARGSVINLIQVEGLPEYGQASLAEDQLALAINGIGGEGVTIRRIQKGSIPDDSVDILVLEGEVSDQITLSRILSLAYKIYVGSVQGPDVTLTDGVSGTTRIFEGGDLSIGDDIRVIADEAGALFLGDANIQESQGLLSGFGQGGGSAGGSANLGRVGLDNRVDANIARASAIELAGGQILSFIEVVDLPQVRIDIRVFEVNRTKLLSYQSDLGVLGSDFTQGGLNPAASASTLQGASAARVGSSGRDIQDVFSFLEGTLTNQLQLSGSNWAVDALFSFLEKEGVARSLANPSLSVLSGENAIFEVGGQVPIDESFGTQVGIEGVFSTTSFIEFGVKLAVRPLVGENDFITIDFAPEIITPDAALTQALVEATGSNPSTFAFDSRLLKTSSRLADGQTMLVGGLQQTQRSDNDASAPWLSDVPLLGLLFQGFDYSDDDLEVVVMIRPSIVRDPLPDAAMWVYPGACEMLQGALPRRRPRVPEESGEFEEPSANARPEPGGQVARESEGSSEDLVAAEGEE